MKKIQHIYFCLFVLLASYTSFASTGDQKYSQYSYGGIGLVQTPTARFSNDGEFGFGVSTEEPWNRLYGRVQFFPWMEAVIRYTEGEHQAYNPGSKQTWKDKGIDLKFRVLDETELRPEIAIGFIDLGGTGAYSSEYIVASKSFNNIDLSLGLGWGKLGGVDHFDNLLGWIDEERKVRGGYSQRGGTINLNRFFSGESTSVFGGFEYFTPIPNLSLKLEYDSNDYSFIEGKERKLYQTGDIFTLDSRVNYALNYRFSLGDRDNIDLSLGFLRGNTLYASVNVHSNLNISGKPKIVLGPEKIRNSTLPADSFSGLNKRWQNFLTNRIIREMGNLGFVTHNVSFNGDELAAEISQGRFLKTSDFLDLASRVLANNAPKNIKTITVINIDQGIETLRSSINRDKLRNTVARRAIPEDMYIYDNRIPIGEDKIVSSNNSLYPNFFWTLKPHALGTLQHQRKFYFWQVEALLQTEYAIKKGLYLYTDIGIDIVNNYEDYSWHIPDGELHHVRQDRRLYLTEGESGLRRMALDYLVNITPNLSTKISAGYLEWMFGGVGGEIIYMPNNRRWALGVDAYWLKQRDFDQKFGFQNYETVTGFLNYYQDIPFYDMRLKIGAGKFLGKDKGFEIDLSRRFKTGAIVGGVVTLTDCDSVCVGEGSFNKWVYFELPMDLFYVSSSTRNKAGYSWAPLTKDAGQRVSRSNLYSIMTSAPDEIDTLRAKELSIKKIFSGFGTKPKKRI